MVATKTKSMKRKGKVTEREVLHPAIKVSLTFGEAALTAAHAYELLGCTENIEDARDAGCEAPLFTDRLGNPIYAKNNLNNRPLYMQVVETLVQEILNKRWRCNGETVIVGKTGLVLNGQHSLVALVLAEQDRTGPQALHWEGVWDGAVTMDKIVVMGVDEDDQIINTMDTCKPRSLTDVIYRSPLFRKLPMKDRKQSSRFCDSAVKLLWDRGGEYADPWTPRKTHAEALAFLDTHPSVLKMVAYVIKQADGKAIAGVQPGLAAGMLYLMSASETDGDTYRNQEVRQETGKKGIDFALQDKAEQFWTDLSGTTEVRGINCVRDALAKLSVNGTLAEKCAVVAKAWALYRKGKKITAEDLVLTYRTKSNGKEVMTDLDTFAGIDVGLKTKTPKASADNGEVVEDEDEKDDKAIEEEVVEDEEAEVEAEEEDEDDDE